MGLMKSYDPDQIVLSFAGILIEGWADGEFVRVSREANSFDDVAGTDGEVARSKNKDRRGTVTFTLLQTSSSNALLSALLARDEVAPGGAGVGELRVEDLQGASLHEAPQAWIQKPPESTYDKTATSREWVIRCADLSMFEGGN